MSKHLQAHELYEKDGYAPLPAFLSKQLVRTEYERTYESWPFPRFSSLSIAKAGSSTPTTNGCVVGEVTNRPARWICMTSSESLNGNAEPDEAMSPNAWKAGGAFTGKSSDIEPEALVPGSPERVQ